VLALGRELSLLGLQLHAPSDAYIFACFVLGLFGLIALAAFIRCLRMDRWLRGPKESRETVTGVVARTYGWNLRRDFRIAFITLGGLRIEDNAPFGEPMLGTLGLQKGDPVEITYCTTDAQLFYVSSRYESAKRAVFRGLFLNPLWLLVLGLAGLYLVFVA
jgi:hypothetical protein